ncbi:hypothetical protein SLE2022_338860 [Rubroshorea leprosula]
MVLMISEKSLDRRKLPPGPGKLPIIGSLHLFIYTLPHYILQDLAKIYGPVMHMKFGEVPTFVLSSTETVGDALKTDDLFVARPQFQSLKLLTYGFSDLGTAPYGDYVRLGRRIFATEFVNNSRFRLIREGGVEFTLKHIIKGRISNQP